MIPSFFLRRLLGGTLTACFVAGVAVAEPPVGEIPGWRSSTEVATTSRVNPLPERRWTVEERLAQVGPAAGQRMRPAFERAGVAYPPDRLALVGLKEEKQLQVFAAGADGAWRWVKTYRVLAASGGPGPKLREGDRQVPEGLYRIEALNPNSRFHLSLRVDYPNAADREQAGRDGRTQLGGDIMIHGNAVSVGCLAMGDEAAEELFVLAARTGLERVEVVLSPVDFRVRGLPAGYEPDGWVRERYRAIARVLRVFPCAP